MAGNQKEVNSRHWIATDTCIPAVLQNNAYSFPSAFYEKKMPDFYIDSFSPASLIKDNIFYCSYGITLPKWVRQKSSELFTIRRYTNYIFLGNFWTFDPFFLQ